MDRCLQNLRTAGVISEETFRAALRDQSQAAAPANGARGTGLKRPL